MSGSVDIDLSEHIDRKTVRFMGSAAAYAYIAMKQAIEDAGLTEEQVSNPRTGLIAASGGALFREHRRICRRYARQRR